tara:strand:+ start:578 stop:691 length:114 start_codon:yes stop_codon:yes gene_type:complete
MGRRFGLGAWAAKKMVARGLEVEECCVAVPHMLAIAR